MVCCVGIMCWGSSPVGFVFPGSVSGSSLLDWCLDLPPCYE